MGFTEFDAVTSYIFLVNTLDPKPSQTCTVPSNSGAWVPKAAEVKPVIIPPP